MNEEDHIESAYRAYYPVIRRYVARLVGEAEADDVAQETFVKALRSAADLRGGDSLRPWLYRVATNAALDRLRSPARARLRPLPYEDGQPTEGGSTAECSKPSFESDVISGQMSACVRAVVDRLPENQRLVLLLSEFEELTDAEIAGVMNASLGSVKIRLHRARARLRAELDSSCRIYADSRNEIACEPVVPVSRILRRRS